ncbi:hypothetical protein TNCV_1854531 [Trichonephila clavipes]|nr:hypothetical protein TNCV_1854531 [Trichonephila clavipes]
MFRLGGQSQVNSQCLAPKQAWYSFINLLKGSFPYAAGLQRYKAGTHDTPVTRVRYLNHEVTAATGMRGIKER